MASLFPAMAVAVAVAVAFPAVAGAVAGVLEEEDKRFFQCPPRRCRETGLFPRVAKV